MLYSRLVLLNTFPKNQKNQSSQEEQALKHFFFFLDGRLLSLPIILTAFMTNNVSIVPIGIGGKEQYRVIHITQWTNTNYFPQTLQWSNLRDWSNKLCLWRSVSTVWKGIQVLTPGTGLTRAQENRSDRLSYTFLKWIIWSTLVSDQRHQPHNSHLQRTPRTGQGHQV